MEAFLGGSGLSFSAEKVGESQPGMLSFSRRNLCEEHSEIWPTLEKSYLKFSRNLVAFKSALTRCEIASRTRSRASLVSNIRLSPDYTKKNSSRRLQVVWSPDLASRCNLSHRGRSRTYGKRKQETCVIDGKLLRHPCVIRLGRLRAWIHSRTSRRAILR